jgi:hypothetical protein
MNNTTDLIDITKRLYDLLRERFRRWDTTRVRLANSTVCNELGILLPVLVEAQDLLVSAQLMTTKRLTSKTLYILPAMQA